MRIDRYPTEDIVARVPQMAARIDPILRRLDTLLDDDALYQAVRADVGQRHPRTRTFGRPSTPVELLLRLLLKHLQHWSFQETEDQVDQRLVLRWFCRLFWREMPDDTTLIRWSHTLRPETLHQLVDRTAELARQAKVTQGRKLRLDGTGVQTGIHHPTDRRLLVDRVRTLGQLVTQAKRILAAEGTKMQQRCRSRLRTARRAAQAQHRQLRRTGEDKDAEQKKQDQTLVETTGTWCEPPTQVVQHLRQATMVAQRLGQRQHALRLRDAAQRVLPLVERVISQTRRRVFEGTKVPSDEKVLSLVEPHTKAVPRSPWRPAGGVRAAGSRTTCVEGGIITRDEIVAHPAEHGQVVTAVDHHVALFDYPPGLVAADRGVHAADTEARLRERGVRQVVAIPASGKLSAERHALEHPRAFRRGHRFRAGTRGRMASLRRDHGWRACRSHGLDGMERWLGLGVMESLLNWIARTLW